MLSETQKFDLLKTMYVETNKELAIGRERNWNTMKLAIGANVAIAGVTAFTDSPPAFIFLVLSLALVASIYLNKNFTWFKEKRAARVRIEKALSMFEESAFISGETLLPAHFENAEAIKAGTYSFVAAIWIVAIATMASILLK